MARAADEADERERRVQEEFDLEAALRSKRGRKRHVDEDPYGLAGLEPPRKKPVPAPKIGRAHPSASALTLDSQDDAEIAFLTRNNKRRRGREDEVRDRGGWGDKAEDFVSLPMFGEQKVEHLSISCLCGSCTGVV